MEKNPTYCKWSSKDFQVYMVTAFWGEDAKPVHYIHGDLTEEQKTKIKTHFRGAFHFISTLPTEVTT